MSRFSLPFTRLIHENLSIIMTFAYSRRPIERMVDETFVGEWKHLRKAVFTLSEERAEKACLEVALFLRMLDDEQSISEYLKKRGNPDFGWLECKNKPVKPLSLRDVANKIIHSAGFEWDFPDEKGGTKIGRVDVGPKLICLGSDAEKWERAEVHITSLAAAVGSLMG